MGYFGVPQAQCTVGDRRAAPARHQFPDPSGRLKSTPLPVSECPSNGHQGSGQVSPASRHLPAQPPVQTGEASFPGNHRTATK